MRFIFKTSYDAGHPTSRATVAMCSGTACSLRVLIVAPWVVAEYWLAQLTFVLIYGIVGLGLMLLAGFTGQFSIGHAAFLGTGAYTQARADEHGGAVSAGAGGGCCAVGGGRRGGGAAGAAREGHLPRHCDAGRSASSSRRCSRGGRA